MSNTLYWQVSGQGDDLVLIHGWGMNGAIWQKIVETLSGSFRVHVVDLPGHGHSHHCDANNIEEIAQQLIVNAPKNAIWIGWSLGGLIATHVALYHKDHVKKLVTVASSPKFSADEKENEWQGIKPELLIHFTEQLKDDFQTTIERFIALQSMGSQTARQDVKGLKQVLLSRPLPSLNSLLVGLKILSDIDFRAQIQHISIPTLRLYGLQDNIVPAKVINDIEKLLPNTEQYIFTNSSHCPFMTETELFCDKLLYFANQ